MKIHKDNAGYLTKMAVMPIYGKKNFKKLLSRNHWVDFDETLCMKHQRPKPFIFCSYYDPWLTLTYFMARSNFAT